MSEPTELQMLLQDERQLVEQIAEIQEMLHKLQFDLCITRDALSKYEHLSVAYKSRT